MSKLRELREEKTPFQMCEPAEGHFSVNTLVLRSPTEKLH